MPAYEDGIDANIGLGIPLESTTALAVAAAGTIPTNVYNSRVAPAGAVAGCILQPGVKKRQEVIVTNEAVAANTVTFAAAGTSNVANGVGSVIPGLTARKFIWDTVTALWYPEI